MISSFGGLTYTAFFEHDYEGNCGVGVSCMGVISKLVATILVERFLFTILFDNVRTRLHKPTVLLLVKFVMFTFLIFPLGFPGNPLM
jgi:hypothetical protein